MLLFVYSASLTEDLPPCQKTHLLPCEWEINSIELKFDWFQIYVRNIFFNWHPRLRESLSHEENWDCYPATIATPGILSAMPAAVGKSCCFTAPSPPPPALPPLSVCSCYSNTVSQSGHVGVMVVALASTQTAPEHKEESAEGLLTVRTEQSYFCSDPEMMQISLHALWASSDCTWRRTQSVPRWRRLLNHNYINSLEISLSLCIYICDCWILFWRIAVSQRPRQPTYNSFKVQWGIFVASDSLHAAFEALPTYSKVLNGNNVYQGLHLNCW